MRGTTQMNKRNYREIYLILNKLGKEYIDKILNKSSIYLMISYTESFGIVLEY